MGLMRRPMRLLWSASGVVLTAAWLMFVPAAQAQVPAPTPSEQTPDISDKKLDAAAAALHRVASVRADYQQRLESAPASDADNIADEAKGALVKAITDQGLSVEEYVSILKVAENDPAVREKIVKRIQGSQPK
jgi:hypothetical protein